MCSVTTVKSKGDPTFYTPLDIAKNVTAAATSHSLVKTGQDHQFPLDL